MTMGKKSTETARNKDWPVDSKRFNRYIFIVTKITICKNGILTILYKNGGIPWRMHRFRSVPDDKTLPRVSSGTEGTEIYGNNYGISEGYSRTPWAQSGSGTKGSGIFSHNRPSEGRLRYRAAYISSSSAAWLAGPEGGIPYRSRRPWVSPARIPGFPGIRAGYCSGL